MERDCGCKHHARNIMVDRFNVNVNGEQRLFPFDGYEANVQNALELIYSTQGIQKLIDVLENMDGLSSYIKELKQMVSALEDQVLDEDEIKAKVLELISLLMPKQQSKLKESYVIGKVCYNPNAKFDGESLYYQSFFSEPLEYSYIDNGRKVVVNFKYTMDLDSILYPNLTSQFGSDTDENKLVQDDINIFSTTIYGHDFTGMTAEDIETYLQSTPLNKDKDENDNNSKNWVDVIKEKIIEGKRAIEWDVNVLQDFLDAVESEEEIVIPDYENEGEFHTLRNNKESWVKYLIYRNPFAMYGMPRLKDNTFTDTDTGIEYPTINALDASAISVTSAHAGAGRKDLQTIWTGQVNAKDAAQVLEYSAAAGVGKYKKTAEGWKQYAFEKDIENISSIFGPAVDENEIKINVMTQEEYDNLQTKSNKILYVIVEGD